MRSHPGALVAPVGGMRRHMVAHRISVWPAYVALLFTRCHNTRVRTGGNATRVTALHARAHTHTVAVHEYGNYLKYN